MTSTLPIPALPFRLGFLLALLFPLLVACGEAPEGEIVERGDQAFARGDLDEALAEYRLALRQGSRSAEVLSRAGHVYAEQGRITDARELYLEAITADPDMAEFAAADFMALAKRAAERQDGVTAASALDAATEMKPGVAIEGLALPLARHFVEDGRHEQALPFYLRAVREGAPPAVVHETALAYYEVGDCASAMLYFAEVRGRLSVADRENADWRSGSCAIELAREAEAKGDLEGALRHYREMLAFGVPGNRIVETWMEIAELYAAQGECAAAADALQTALARTDITPAAEARGNRRLDELRFRRGTVGPC